MCERRGKAKKKNSRKKYQKENIPLGSECAGSSAREFRRPRPPPPAAARVSPQPLLGAPAGPGPSVYPSACPPPHRRPRPPFRAARGCSGSVVAAALQGSRSPCRRGRALAAAPADPGPALLDRPGPRARRPRSAPWGRRLRGHLWSSSRRL